MTEDDNSSTPSLSADIGIRVACVFDMENMSQLAFRAKAYWGYSESELSRWADDLRVEPESIAVWPTFVAESDGELLGWVQLDPTREPWVLESLWVDPSYIDRGVGRRLLSHALATAARAGHKRLLIDADPHAAGFYRRCGARQIGELAAPISGDSGRVRPQFEIDTARASLSRDAPC